MARYKVLEPSFIGNRFCSEGDIVSFDGEAGPNLELLDDPLDHDDDGKKGGARKVPAASE